MKGIYYCLTAALFMMSLQAFAADITCKWIGGDEGQPGDKLSASTSENQITLTQHEWAGTYPRLTDEDVHGHDGKTYYSYDAGYNDGANRVLIDRDLLKSGKRGLLKLRGRGEGFFEQRFVCFG